MIWQKISIHIALVIHNVVVTLMFVHVLAGVVVTHNVGVILMCVIV